MGNKHGKKKGKHRKDKANSAPVGIASPTNNGGGNRAAAATAAASPHKAAAQPPPPAGAPAAVKRQPSGDAEPLVLDEFSDVHDDYMIDYSHKPLGSGHYGKVWAGVSRATGERVAIKTIIKRKLRRPKVLLREIEILRALKHKYILHMQDVYEDKRCMHIVTEMCTGGELFDRIVKRGHYSEHDAAKLCVKILHAIRYCHAQNVVHRDLKPENVLFQNTTEEATMKIIDFGLSRVFDQHSVTSSAKELMHTRVGTPYYIAPEVIGRNYGPECDLWSIGVILYILLCGYPPFWGDSDAEIFKRVRHGDYDKDGPEWAAMSDTGKDLIGQLLQLDPDDRPTPDECLRHPFLRAAARDEEFLDHTSSHLGSEDDGGGGGGGEDGAEGGAEGGARPRGASSPMVGAARKQKLDPKVLGRLKKFAAHNKFKQCCVMTVAKMLNQNEIQELKNAFHAIDTGDTGFITSKQLLEAMLRTEVSATHDPCDEAGGHYPRESKINHLHAEVARVFDALDAHHEGKISIREFIGATVQRRVYMQENLLHKVFDHFDPAHTGRITLETLTVMLNRKPNNGDDYEAAEMADTEMARMMRESINEKMKKHKNSRKWGVAPGAKDGGGGGGGGLSGGGMHRTRSVHALHKENWDQKMVHEVVSKCEVGDDNSIDFQEFLALFQGSGSAMRASSRKMGGRIIKE